MHLIHPLPTNLHIRLSSGAKTLVNSVARFGRVLYLLQKKRAFLSLIRIFFCCSVHPNLILGKLTLGGFLSSSLLQLGTFAGFCFFNSIFHQEPRTSPLSHTIMSGSFCITFLLTFYHIFHHFLGNILPMKIASSYAFMHFITFTTRPCSQTPFLEGENFEEGPPLF